MAKPIDPTQQLASFLAKFTDDVASLAEACLNEMRGLYPTALELVYDNYNALAIGFGPTDAGGGQSEHGLNGGAGCSVLGDVTLGRELASDPTGPDLGRSR